jgi:hypothetical protein
MSCSWLYPLQQIFEAGSVLNPDSIRSVDPDPDQYSEIGSESGSREAKMTHKSKKNNEIKV